MIELANSREESCLSGRDDTGESRGGNPDPGSKRIGLEKTPAFLHETNLEIWAARRFAGIFVSRWRPLPRATSSQ